MKLSLNWLGDWVDPDGDVDAIAGRLTTIGLTVDGVDDVGRSVADVVVGRILDVTRHPNADRLSLCRVDAGGEEPVSVVCGAPNVTAGERYPFAPVGATLPGGLTLKKVKIRGETSMGMLCSASELGLSTDHSGLMTLDTDAAPGSPLADALGLDDAVLDLDVPYNRPDWLSVRGVARELAAATRTSVRGPVPSPAETGPPAAESVRVTLVDPVGCPLYGARIVRGVRIGPSPAWLVRRLEAIGQRSINNVVDVTNYVLHTYGQPIHAFDLGHVRGAEIRVRRSEPGERLTTLDGVDRALPAGTLVIADAEGAVALAGIMGGADSEVTEDTTSILIESALFDAEAVRDGARGLSMETEASMRFSRGVDPAAVLTALDHTAQWIVETGGGEVSSGRVVAGAPPVADRTVPLREARVAEILGQPVPRDEIESILTRLGFTPAVEGGDTAVWRCRVPSWRTDVTREIDLIEEVARFHGYDRFEARQFNAGAVSAVRSPLDRLLDASARAFVGLGFREVQTFGLMSEARAVETQRWSLARGDTIVLRNAKSRETNALRGSVAPGHLEVVRHNVNRGVTSLRLFEHGKVFWSLGSERGRHGTGYDEAWECAGVVVGPWEEASWGRPAQPIDLFALKGLLDAWCRAMRFPAPRYAPSTEAVGPLARADAVSIEIDGERWGWAGRVHPDVALRADVPADTWLFSIDFERGLTLNQVTPCYREASRFPAVKRDLAFVVPKTAAHADVEAAITAAGRGMVSSVRLFDVYEGEPVPEGSRSLAYALEFQSTERSLTSADVDAVADAIVAALARDFHAVLRDT